MLYLLPIASEVDNDSEVLKKLIKASPHFCNR